MVMRIAKIAITLCLFVAAFFGLQQLLVPKYMSGVYEGALIGEYYAEEKKHDLIIIGDCEVYASISPVTLWEKYGISSYIRGGPQQLVWHSYYLLEDTLRYEKPRAVIFNVLAMRYGEPQRESYNRLNIDGMRLSPSKIASARVSIKEGESVLSYVFPLLRFHSRWDWLQNDGLGVDDFKYYFDRNKVSVNGFMVNCGVKPADFVPDGKKLPDYRFSERCYDYLDRITNLCKENGIELILIKAPSNYPYWYSQWDKQMVAYADEHGLIYKNCFELADEIGIDLATDTYDGGQHLNVYGAEKLADYLGAIVADFVPDRRQDSDYARIWDEKARAYHWMVDAQERELAETGVIETYVFSG